MTPVTDIRNDVLEQAITAQAHGHQQDRLTYNPGGPIDSIIEHALAAAPGTTGPQRQHLKEIVLLAQQVLASNGQERTCVQRIAGHAERLGRQPWTIDSLARELGPLLADLRNPMITKTVERQRLRRLAEILTEAPENHLRSASLARRLRKSKTDLLQRFLDDTVLERLA
jgi:hypothetical protein